MQKVSRLLVSGLFILAACAPESPKVSRAQPNSGQAAAPASTPSTTTPGTTETSKPAGSGDAAQAGNGGMTSSGAPVDTTIPAGPTTAPIAVTSGLATFDLSTAKAGLTGSTMTVNLQVNPAAGAAAASVTFSQIAIKTPANTGFVVYRPVLVSVGADGKEKQFPIGTNIKLNVPKGRQVPLAGLTTINFEGVSASDKIKMRFSALEPIAETFTDGIPNYRECKAPQNFQAVATALQPCKACHSGLFAYDFMDKDNATACGQNLKMIDRTLSPTGTTPAIPGGTHHGTNGGAVTSAMGPWRSGEGL